MAIISGNHPESAGIRSCKACLPPGNAPRLMRKAISGNLEASPHQWQSVAISGNLEASPHLKYLKMSVATPPESAMMTMGRSSTSACRMTSRVPGPPLTCMQRNQRPSETIRAIRRMPLTTTSTIGTGRMLSSSAPFAAWSSQIRLSNAARNMISPGEGSHQRSSEVIRGHQRSSEVI